MPTTTTTVTSATASGAIATVTTTVAIPEAKAVLGEGEEEKEEEEDVEESSSTTYDCPAASQVDEFGYKYVEFHGIVYVDDVSLVCSLFLALSSLSHFFKYIPFLPFLLCFHHDDT